MALQVDVVSDIVCPWCFIGKRRLGGALDQVRGPTLVRWHPMQLFPDVPEQGADLNQYLSRRFGDMDLVQSELERLRATGLQLGIRFDFEGIRRLPNTLNAHRLILSAGTTQQDRFVENLFKGFFEEGLDLSDRDVLLSVAEDSGMDQDLARKALDDGRTLQAVMDEQKSMRELGLAGLPNFLVNRSFAVSGPQDKDTLLRAFDYALFGLPEEGAQTPVLH